MSGRSTVQVNGAIEFCFSVVDFELAKRIDQLLKQNPHYVTQPAADRIKNGKGRTAKTESGSIQTKVRVLQILKEKFGSKTFTISEAASLINNKLGVKLTTIRRALRMGIDQGILQRTRKGMFSFLELALPQPPSTGSGSSEDPIP